MGCRLHPWKKGEHVLPLIMPLIASAYPFVSVILEDDGFTVSSGDSLFFILIVSFSEACKLHIHFYMPF
jgi:hypothetical protein